MTSLEQAARELADAASACLLALAANESGCSQTTSDDACRHLAQAIAAYRAAEKEQS